jgi:plastocyanin
MRAAALALIAIAAVGGPARAGGRIVGTVALTGGDPGATAADAIVYVVGFTEPAPTATPEIQQKNKRFVPDLIAITAGQTVSFPNGDPLFHNVFSRSAARPFDLGSYRRGETKAKGFPTTGVVDVYCNIHPEMAATILVLPNRKFTRVGADGRFAIAGVPAGTWTVFAYARLSAKPASAKVTVVDGADATVALALEHAAVVAHPNKYGEAYRDPAKYR